METKTKYLLIGLGIVGVGVGGYFLYKKYKGTATEGETEDFTNQLDDQKPVAQNTSPSTKPAKVYSKPKVVNSTFPLKYNSRGTLVKDVQEALIKKFGGELFPKFGADGYFEDEMVSALQKLGLPSTIDEKLYGEILQGKAGKLGGKTEDKPKTSSPSLSNDSIADLLYSGISQNSIDTVLRGLWKIKNVQHYIKVNAIFKEKRINGGVRKTIATALSHAFFADPERSKYRAQLYRIGLKWRNEKWELAGIESQNKLITIAKTTVFDSSGQSLVVPPQTILGNYQNAKNGLTEFKTLDGKILYVNTTAISYYHD
jgi:hypothetical protein